MSQAVKNNRGSVLLMTAITAAIVSLISLAVLQWNETRRKNLGQERITQIANTLQAKLQQTLSNSKNWETTIANNSFLGCSATNGSCPPEKRKIDVHIPDDSGSRIVFSQDESMGYDSKGEPCSRQSTSQWSGCPFSFIVWFQQVCSGGGSGGNPGGATASGCNNYILSTVRFLPADNTAQTTESQPQPTVTFTSFEKNYSFIVGKNMEALKSTCIANKGEWNDSTSTCSNLANVSPCPEGQIMVGLTAAGTPQCRSMSAIVQSYSSCPHGIACVKDSRLICKENISQCH